jgi:hypothetical protein
MRAVEPRSTVRREIARCGIDENLPAEPACDSEDLERWPESRPADYELCQNFRQRRILPFPRWL